MSRDGPVRGYRVPPLHPATRPRRTAPSPRTDMAEGRRMNPAMWLRNRAAAYQLDADHAERRKTISDMTPTTRRAIADELEACARDVEAALAWEVPE